ncbi:MAG: AAA family ATPase [Verrucomicrobiota bacterium]
MVAGGGSAELNWDVLRLALLARWPVLLFSASLSLWLGVAVLKLRPEAFEASTRILLTEEKESLVGGRYGAGFRPASQNRLKQAESEIRDGRLLLHVVDSCDLVSHWKVANRVIALEEMRKRVETVADYSEGVIEIRMSDSNREAACEMANALAAEFIQREKAKSRAAANARMELLETDLSERRESAKWIENRLVAINAEAGSRDGTERTVAEAKDLRRELVGTSHLVRSLEARLQQAAIALTDLEPDAMIIAAANPGTTEQVNGKAAWIVSSLFAGLLFGVLFVTLWAPRRVTLRVVSRLAERLHVGLVSLVPVSGRTLLEGMSSVVAMIEPYRDLRLKLHRLPAGDSILLALLPGDRKALVAETLVNLGAVIAEAGHTVLVIDGDARNPRLHQFFDAARYPGLSDYLSGEMRLEETVIRSRKPNLWFIPSGPQREDPSSLLTGKRMNDLIWTMRSRFDYILVCAPSIHEYAETGVLAGLADHSIVVSSLKEHSRRALEETREALERSGSNLSGIVLTRFIEFDQEPDSGNRSKSPGEVAASS